MASKSIGELNVKIAGDAKGFQNVIAESEKTLSKFAAKAAAPFTMGFGLGAMAMNPLETVLGPIEKLTEIIPGLDKFTFFFNPQKYAAAMTEVKDATLELARSAEMLNVDPQFLKALRMSAGPLADDLMPGLQKLIKFQQEVRAGDTDAAAVAEKWGLGAQEIANLTSQEFILKFADHLKRAKEEGTAFAMVSDTMSAKALKLTNVFAQGSEGIEKWVGTLKEFGIDPKQMVDMAKVVQFMEKLEKLEAEAVKNQEFMTFGGPRMGARLQMEQAESWTEYFEGMVHYLDTFALYRGALSAMGVGELFPHSGRSPVFEKLLQNAQQLTEVPPVDLEDTPMAQADAAIEKINASLDDQEEMLRLTELGWGNLASTVMAVDKLFAEGNLDIDKMTATLKRLNEMRDAAIAEKEAKEFDQFLAQVMGKAQGNRGGLFAPVATAGSAEAAAAFNREWASGGGGDLILTVEQIRKLMEKPAVPEEMQRNVRLVFDEMRKINDKLNPFGKVNE